MITSQYTLPISVGSAIQLLESGLPVAIPTETVYGLAARISDEAALKLIFLTKGRPADNPLIVHLLNAMQIPLVARVPNEIQLIVEKLTSAFWPGPLSIVLPALPSLSPMVTAGKGTVAVRVPKHEIFLEILKRIGEPLAAPSANLSGRPSPTTADHVLADYQGKVPVVDGGRCAVGVESTVVLPSKSAIHILRSGAVTADEIFNATGVPVSTNDVKFADLSPGTRHAHYAPITPVRLVYSLSELEGAKQSANLSIVLASADSGYKAKCLNLSMHSVYHSLREADNLELDEILVLCSSDVVIDTALYDRLLRASGTL